MRRVIKYALILFCLSAINLAGKPNKNTANTAQNPHSQSTQPTSESHKQPDTKQNCAKNKTPHWYASPEWILAIVAVITLLIVGYQSVQMRKAAEAALLNAKAVIHAERPFLVIPMGEEFSKIENPILITRVPGEYRRSYCNFKIKNFGRSMAKIIEERLALFHGTVPDSTIFDRLSPFLEGYAFPPNEVVPHQATFEPDGRITPQELAEIVTRKRFVWLCGYFRYKDTFDRPDAPEYETRFCFRWVYDQTKSTDPSIHRSFWIMAGPSEYNRAT